MKEDDLLADVVVNHDVVYLLVRDVVRDFMVEGFFPEAVIVTKVVVETFVSEDAVIGFLYTENLGPRCIGSLPRETTSFTLCHPTVKDQSCLIIGFFLRFLRICRKEHLEEEIRFIKEAFLSLGYPKGRLIKLLYKARRTRERGRQSNE